MDLHKFSQQLKNIGPISGDKGVLKYVAQHFKELNDEIKLERPVSTRASAQWYLGWLYYKGSDGFPIDIPKAIELLESSVQTRHSKMAFHFLGECYRDMGFFEKAFNSFVKAESWYYVGVCYNNGEGVTEDSSKAFESFSKCVANPDDKDDLAAASYYIGYYYLTGDGVEKDQIKAFPFLEKAAKMGYELSFYTFANVLYFGFGCIINKKAALYWCKKAAAMGNLKAIALQKIMEEDAHEARLDKIFERKKDKTESSGGAAGGAAPKVELSAGAAGGAAPEAASSVGKKRKAVEAPEVPASVAFAAPAIDSVSSKAIKKAKVATLSPEQKSAKVLVSIAERKAAKASAAAGGAAVEKPVIQKTFPERTALHYHDAELLESICFCAIEKSPPSLSEAVELLTVLGFNVEYSSDGHEFWSKNKHDQTIALPVFDDLHSGRIKFSKSDKASGMYPIHYGQLWKLLGLIDFDGTPLKCPVCKK